MPGMGLGMPVHAHTPGTQLMPVRAHAPGSQLGLVLPVPGTRKTVTSATASRACGRSARPIPALQQHRLPRVGGTAGHSSRRAHLYVAHRYRCSDIGGCGSFISQNGQSPPTGIGSFKKIWCSDFNILVPLCCKLLCLAPALHCTTFSFSFLSWDVVMSLHDIIPQRITLISKIFMFWF